MYASNVIVIALSCKGIRVNLAPRVLGKETIAAQAVFFFFFEAGDLFSETSILLHRRGKNLPKIIFISCHFDSFPGTHCPTEEARGRVEEKGNHSLPHTLFYCFICSILNSFEALVDLLNEDWVSLVFMNLTARFSDLLF